MKEKEVEMKMSAAIAMVHGESKLGTSTEVGVRERCSGWLECFLNGIKASSAYSRGARGSLSPSRESDMLQSNVALAAYNDLRYPSRRLFFVSIYTRLRYYTWAAES